MNDAQDVVTVPHRVHQHPEGEEVKNLVQGLVLVEHLAVDGIGVLNPPVDHVLDAKLRQPVVHLGLGAEEEGVVFRLLGVQPGDDLVVAHRVQVFEGQVLQLPLDALHPQAVGDGGVNLHGLQGLLLLLLRGLVFHGPHVVKTVGNLNEDDPDILAHGHEHLPEVLHLLIFLGGVLDAGQLANPLHQIGDGGGKHPGHVLVGGRGVLDDIMEQGGLNGLGVQLQLLRHNLGHGQGMDDIGLAAFALLPLVAAVRIRKSGADMIEICGGIIASDGFFQKLILFLYGHLKSPPFLAGGADRGRRPGPPSPGRGSGS